MTYSSPMPQRAMPPVAATDESLRSAMRASAIGMAIADLSGKWIEVNPALAAMLGCRGEQCVGQSMQACIHPDDRAMASGLLDGLLAGNESPVDATWRYLRPDGSVAWAQANVGVMRDRTGVAQTLLVQMRDITVQSAAQAQCLAEAQRRSDALDLTHHQLQLFSDAVAHDLRAPLRAIESFSGLLERNASEQLDDTGRDHLRRIRAAATRMSGLLVALGELSNATNAKLKPAEVDLSLLAEWVAAELQEADPDRQAEIEVQPGMLGWGDERLLKQLLQQLMGNAWKFSRDRESVRIEVSAERVGGMMRLVVRDAGCGFDPHYAHKLFEPFQRLHSADQGGGHGLGLAIARRVAERHGGSISAEPVPDGGATFRVDLPAAAAAKDPSHA